ncbi:hypothetical protein [Actinophytocola xanthii]|uniref:Uncharacterized protein n=1 Tax=Actinophytocola xanthii TaxID=1912961 RepID=A0A1Q8CSR1_9PSEU|nr:hypothetical protein [Actinophytocola xanthii]OLF17376.1 hypothetical protein BU204_12255 [Actinophytocola xanthii]
MQSEVRAPDEWPHGQVIQRGSDISVLAATRSERVGGRAGLRLGARVLPVGRWMARRHALVGAEVGVTASLLDQLPVAPTVVIVVAPEVEVDDVVEQLLTAAHGMLTLHCPTSGPLTLGVANPDPVRAGSAGKLVMYNQHLEALPEALVEAVAAARRWGLTTAHGNCVLLLQPFVPATATAVVHAHPDRHRAVRVDGRWGLTEAQSPADTFEVPADGGAIREQLAWKPTAHVTADGGTHIVSLPVAWRYRYSLGRATVRQLASLSRNAAVTAGRPLSLDVALASTGPVVLRCRPANS